MVSLSPYLKYKKKEHGGVTTNLERAGIGMSMGIWDGTPAPLLQADLKGQEGVATNPERTDIGMGMCKGGW